jgi:hypothetical protein
MWWRRICAVAILPAASRPALMPSAARISGEALPPLWRPTAGQEAGFEELLVLGIIGTIVVGGVLRAIFGRLLGAGLASGIVGFGAWTLTGCWRSASREACWLSCSCWPWARAAARAGSAARGSGAEWGAAVSAGAVEAVAGPAEGADLAAAALRGIGEHVCMLRILRHLLTPAWVLDRVFPAQVLAAIEAGSQGLRGPSPGRDPLCCGGGSGFRRSALGGCQLGSGLSRFSRGFGCGTRRRTPVFWCTSSGSIDRVEIVADRGITARVTQPNGTVSAAPWKLPSAR